MWYEIDISKFVKHLLPPVLRRKRLLAFMGCVVAPMVYVYEAFRVYRDVAIRKMNISGQVIYIEQVLNGQFSPENKKIYLTDIVDDTVFLHIKIEDKPLVYFHKKTGQRLCLNRKGEGNYRGNFTVHIPISIADREMEIRRLVDFYKPAGRSYVIEYY